MKNVKKNKENPLMKLVYMISISGISMVFFYVICHAVVWLSVLVSLFAAGLMGIILSKK